MNDDGVVSLCWEKSVDLSRVKAAVVRVLRGHTLGVLSKIPCFRLIIYARALQTW